MHAVTCIHACTLVVFCKHATLCINAPLDNEMGSINNNLNNNSINDNINNNKNYKINNNININYNINNNIINNNSINYSINYSTNYNINYNINNINIYISITIIVHFLHADVTASLASLSHAMFAIRKAILYRLSFNIRIERAHICLPDREVVVVRDGHICEVPSGQPCLQSTNFTLHVVILLESEFGFELVTRGGSLGVFSFWGGGFGICHAGLNKAQHGSILGTAMPLKQNEQ
ncbi:hypothetical protein HELRODRAFT_164234 [Helobdella robusta]|uniref:Uncharacterized protein n=1 Tax=Helobdella robusta TaxID=6412 RepID=T1EV54_HELRO|nr:hypothetical protein HELRODRAFT_164234 [Helobdella robusta]ESN94402.1 hypothetical protein HELRODRAFT_164234 [Helobdella robusta]